MELSMDGFESLLIDVGVNLGRGNIGVAKHFLDNAQIGAVAKQVRGEAVPEQMRINVLLQAGVARNLFHDLPDTRSC